MATEGHCYTMKANYLTMYRGNITNLIPEHIAYIACSDKI